MNFPECFFCFAHLRVGLNEAKTNFNDFFSLEEFREFENGNMEVGDDYLKSVGILITGDGVEAASVVIGRNVKSEEKVGQKNFYLQNNYFKLSNISLTRHF